MTPFGNDGRADGTVSDVPDPAGTIGFSPSLSHRQVPGSWATWSHGYTSDVYFTGGPQITITLPAGTKAFYFYAEPEQFAVFSVQATAQDGTTPGRSVQGEAGRSTSASTAPAQRRWRRSRSRPPTRRVRGW
jgi:hypothetical protein